ncbi:MAG: hypothetical protein IH848_10460 [Acidobacteria bacterium]|nr:hypothetical protein [Acidobacteriota bacterium]
MPDPPHPPHPPHPPTLTHARLRRAQGDTQGAIAILEALIDEGAGGEELRQLYLALAGDQPGPHFEPELASEEAPHPAALESLTAAFRRELDPRASDESVRRLERWLTRVRRENA